MSISRKTFLWLLVVVVVISAFIIFLWDWISPPAQGHNQIVFTGQNKELYLINPDGSRRVQVTHGNWRNTDKALPSIVYKLPRELVARLDRSIVFFDASWSPDGLRIAYESNQDGHESSKFNIYTSAPDGSGQTQVTNLSTWWVAYPTWSPDGSKLAFAASFDVPDWDIFIVNLDGTDVMQLTELPGSEGKPDWSPDGKQITFDATHDGGSEIYTIRLDGSELKRLTYNDVNMSPSWSPDGSQIAFVSRRDGNHEIYVMNRDGSNQQRLTYEDSRDDEPSWSPDGSEIVFVSERDGNFEIYIMNKDGSDQRRITYTPEPEHSPDWTP